MKHFFTFILVAITVVVGIGQSPAPYQKKILSLQLRNSGLNRIIKHNYAQSRLAENQIYRLDSIAIFNKEENMFFVYKLQYYNQTTISDILAHGYDEDRDLLFLSNITIKYNPNGTIQHEYELDWLFEEEKWDTLRKTVYHYNAKNLLIKTERFEAPDWELYSKTEFSYDSFDRLTGESTYQSHENWFNTTKTDYIYQEGRIVEERLYDWYRDQWNYVHKTSFSYDTYGNSIEDVFSNTVLSSDDELSPYRKYVNTYDLSIEKTNIIFPESFKMENQYNNMFVSSVQYDYDENSEEWIEAGTLNFFYSPLKTTGIRSGSNRVFNIHPNPCTDVIRLNLDNNTNAVFELYDQLGVKVLSQNVKGNETLSIQSLSAGLYNGILISGNEKSFTRLVKTN